VTRASGLAYDACRGELYVSDPFAIVTFAGAQFPTCSPLPIGCCTGIPGQFLIGLCVLPSTEVSSNSPCFQGTVPSCLAMQHVLRGDPTIGNFGFALDLQNAPGATFAFCRFNVGGCTPSTNFSGVLCGQVPAGGNLCIFVWTGGTSGSCNGFATCPLPIPNLPLFCGLILSTAWFGVDGPPVNNYASNCLTWMIGAS
jgi:hypothetical protein